MVTVKDFCMVLGKKSRNPDKTGEGMSAKEAMREFLDDEFFLKLVRLGAKFPEMQKPAREILDRLYKERNATTTHGKEKE